MGVKGRRGRSILIATALSLFVLFGFVLTRESPLTEPLLASAPHKRSTPVETTALFHYPVEAPVPLREVVRDPEPSPEPAPAAARALVEEEEPVPDIDQLIRDLAHDNVPKNARAARWELLHFLRGSTWWDPQHEVVVTASNVNAYNMRAVCRDRLGDALYSGDHQQRQLAANILISGSKKPFPSALSGVLVEALRYDYIDGWTCYADNSGDAVTFFVARPEEVSLAAPLLRFALSSDDGQQRFLAAFILGCVSRAGEAPTICPLLIAHLSDNKIPCDAGMARVALYRMGPSALPYIRTELLYTTDHQAGRLLTGLEAAILRPGHSATLRSRDGGYRPPHYEMASWGPAMSRDRRYTPR